MALNLPAGVTASVFLRDYWQRKPLLMRGALSPRHFSLSADELAGLACDEAFESRLVIERPQRDLRHGPFGSEDFAGLPPSHWTLLVQDVDKYVPAVADLVDQFDFIPQWRIDDIMISFAVDGGGVGPHTDAYDVFLMQAVGRRRWRLSYREYGNRDLVPGLEQRILAHFDTDEDWVLEPGDILYLPPGIAHWGVAKGECMTYSLGFRAPNQQELAADWYQHLVSLARDDEPLLDPGFGEATPRGELGPEHVANAAQLLSRLPAPGSGEFATWLGEHLTEPKEQFQIPPPDMTWDHDQLERHLAADRPLLRHPWARLCWSRAVDDRNGGRELLLFHNGEHTVVPAQTLPLLEALCRKRRLQGNELRDLGNGDAAASTLLLALLNRGVLVGEEDLACE